jgi:L-threonylcarbamoyladenylate synthase
VTDQSTIDIETAAARLLAGDVVALPTETVYGLAADATNADAVLKIFETKGRPRFNPLIIHCADLEMVERYADLPPLALRLARFWPGPLTLVVTARRDSGLSDLVTAGLPTVGIRIPDHALARDLITRVGRPLAAPSANPSGKLSPTTAGQVLRAYDGRVAVLDGGQCRAGLESTIIAVSGDQAVQLRAGALPRSEIEAVLGMPVGQAGEGAAIVAPGMMLKHYAPDAPMRLGATEVEPGERFVAFGPVPDGVVAAANLSASGDLREAARTLFAVLHQLDAQGTAPIAVAPIPETGIGEAINDRLRRAAATHR